MDREVEQIPLKALLSKEVAGGTICVDVTDCCVWVYFMTRCVQGKGSVWM